MERIEKQADTQMEGVDQHAEQKQDMVDKNFKAQKEAVSASDMASAERSADMLDDAKDRSDYQVQTRAELDKLGVRIQAAQEKMNVLGVKAPSPLRQELKVISKEQSTLQETLAEMTEAAPANWEANKSKLDDRISKLDSRISKVTSDIENAAG
jgi:predicted  nucleic acid-binding Zn-ribbon protein